MKKIAPIFLVVITVAVVIYLLFAGASQRQAPALTMTTLDKTTLDTLKRNNKPLLITFWATTCSSCVKEMPHLIELQAAHGDQIDIAGVAMYYDNFDHVNEMIRRKNINYNIIADRDGKISEAFGSVRITPTSFLISPQGQIIYQKIGDIDFEKIKQHIQSAENSHAMG